MGLGGDAVGGRVRGGEFADVGDEADGVSLGGEVPEANRRVAHHVDHFEIDACDREELILPAICGRSVAHDNGLSWKEGGIGAAGIGGEGTAGGGLVMELTKVAADAVSDGSLVEDGCGEGGGCMGGGGLGVRRWGIEGGKLKVSSEDELEG